ncbi:MAG TPA: FHA domain-containing protein [Myxococcales bacterium LLY-WYZ-16_1]|nr:FHA domain-containing protein [Myxococcales bacterium LLY-WYZ-16_1]
MSGRGAPTARWVVPDPPASDEEALRRVLSEARPRFMVRRPEVPEVEIPIDKNQFIIGRAPALADLVLDDELVSRHHATLRIDVRGYFVLEDNGSKNGMTFQDRPTRRLNLHHGDRFFIGRTELEFRAELGRLQSPPLPAKVEDSIMAEAQRPPPDPSVRRKARPAPLSAAPASEADASASSARDAASPVPRPDSEAESDVDGA